MHQLWPVTIPLACAAGIGPGARVLDVGCGTGEPALALAQLAAPRGRVLGVDVSPAMVGIAAARARALGIANAAFRHAAIEQVRGTFDAVTGRFSIMFVPDIGAALAHLRARLAPRRRAAFAVWGPLARNPWMQEVRRQVEAVGGVNADPAAGPHPFRFARRGALERELERAGFRELATDSVEIEATFPTPAIYARSVFETSSSLRAATRGMPATRRQRLERRIARMAAAHVRNGAVRMHGMAWVVSGRR